MKKTIIGVSVAFTLLAGIILAIKSNTGSELNSENVDAMASCEITKNNGKVIVSCPGNENKCSYTRYGYTLTCDGSEDAR